ncbi:MAG: serine hydrolase [Myxococcota bacterium]
MAKMNFFVARRVRPVVAIAFVVFVIAGCRHGIEVNGSGRVNSSTQTRDCTADQSPCRFTVEGAYQETYTAIPAAGWIHDSWENCQEPSGNQCRFNIAADVVADFEDADIPSAVARFRLPIQPLYRDSNGHFMLPEGNASEQVRWLLEELRQPQTTLDEIGQRFSPQFSTVQVRQTIDNLRQLAPDPEISDLIIASPIQVSAVVHDRNSNIGFSLFLQAGYTNDAPITGFTVRGGFPRNGTSVRESDRALNFRQLDDVLASLATDTSMYIGRIENDRCTAVFQRNSQLPLLSASIYKLWVLGALGEGIVAGRISASERLTLTGLDTVRNGSVITSETFGTQISIKDMANLMMSLSDNTATDHLQRRIGRDRIEQALPRFGHRNRDLMTPFLTGNEARHLWGTVTADTVDDYINGSEATQRQIVNNELTPRGSFSRFTTDNFAAGVGASWAASAQDVCGAYAGLRRFNNRSEAFDIVDNAAGGSAVLLGARDRWDRVWYKGGSWATDAGFFVLTLSWLVESDSKGAFVIVLMANNAELAPISDSNRMISLAARAERLISERF